MNLAWALGRAALRLLVDAAVRDRTSADGRSGSPSGATHLMLATGIAALVLAAPGLLIALLAAGLAPGPP